MNIATYHGGGIGKGSAYSAPSTVIQYAYGTLYGVDINYNSGVVVNNNTYRVLSANINVGDLLNTSFVNQGEIQVGIAGIYEINWALNTNCSVAATSVKCGISINSGSIHVSGQVGYSINNTTDYAEISGMVIKNLAANDRIAVCFKALSNTPTIRIGDINLTVHLVKGA